MTTQTDGGRQIRRPATMDDKAYFGLLDRLHAAEVSTRTARAKVLGKVEAAGDRFDKALEAAVGNPGMTRYAQAKKSYVTKIGRLHDELDNTDAGRLAAREAKTKLQGAFAKALGPDLGKVGAVTKNLSVNFSNSWIDFLELIGLKQGKTVASGVATADIRLRGFTEAASRWDGWHWDFSTSNRDALPPSYTQYTDWSNGTIGSRLTALDGSTGDRSYTAATINSNVGFFYTMPATGLLEVWADLVSLDSSHSFRHVDENGFSSVTAHHTASITLGIDQGGQLKQEGRVDDFDFMSEDKDMTNVGYAYPYGRHRWALLRSQRRFNQGQQLWIEIGSSNSLFQYCNDVSFIDQLLYRWALQKVYTHVVP